MQERKVKEEEESNKEKEIIKRMKEEIGEATKIIKGERDKELMDKEKSEGKGRK